MTGSKRLDHWTSGTVCECSEIAGSPNLDIFYKMPSHNKTKGIKKLLVAKKDQVRV
jgi:hypothetical protein